VATYCNQKWTPVKAEDELSKIEPPKNEDAVGSYPDLTGEEALQVKAANVEGRSVITQYTVKVTHLKLSSKTLN